MVVVRGSRGERWFTLQPGAAPELRAAALLETVGDGIDAAVLLHAGQEALKVHVWLDGQWEWNMMLPLHNDGHLTLPPDAVLAESTSREQRETVLDAVYSGVGLHAAGLRAWVDADVEPTLSGA